MAATTIGHGRAAGAKTLTLPTFIIAGERRCGTTSLYNWMRGHPDVYLYPRADMDYFIEHEIKSTRRWRDGEGDAELWERTHSPEAYAEMFREGSGAAAVGQKDADLLFWRPAHPRLARYLPDCRFVITLRDPAGRAWSHYWNEVGKGRETLGFEAALAAEDERSRRSAYARDHLSYRERGYYDRSLESFFSHVDPRRVLVLTLEESHRSPTETLRKVFDFVGVDPSRGLEAAGTRHNEEVTMVPRAWAQARLVAPLERSYTRITEGLILRLTADRARRARARKYARSVFREKAVMPGRLRAELAELYAPHVRRLEGMLGRAFTEWM